MTCYYVLQKNNPKPTKWYIHDKVCKTTREVNNFRLAPDMLVLCDDGEKIMNSLMLYSKLQDFAFGYDCKGWTVPLQAKTLYNFLSWLYSWWPAYSRYPILQIVQKGDGVDGKQDVGI